MFQTPCWSKLGAPNRRPSLCFIALARRTAAAYHTSVFSDGSLAIFAAIRYASSRDFVHWLHIRASCPTDYSKRIRFGLGELDGVEDRFMGRRPKPKTKTKTKTQNQLEELSEENRRLREIVAYLSEAVLLRITETTEPAEQSG